MNTIKHTSILAMFTLCMFEHKASLIYFWTVVCQLCCKQCKRIMQLKVSIFGNGELFCNRIWNTQNNALCLYVIFTTWWEFHDKCSTLLCLLIFFTLILSHVACFIQNGSSTLSNAYNSKLNELENWDILIIISDFGNPIMQTLSKTIWHKILVIFGNYLNRSYFLLLQVGNLLSKTQVQ